MADTQLDMTRRRRAGRRKLPDDDYRGHAVTARFNGAELAELDRRRDTVGMQRGEYLRAAALGQLPTSIPALNIQAWQELARVGANLNQAQHAINEGRATALPLDVLNELRASLAEVRAALIGETE